MTGPRYRPTTCPVCTSCQLDLKTCQLDAAGRPIIETARCIYGGPFRGYIRVPVDGDRVDIESR